MSENQSKTDNLEKLYMHAFLKNGAFECGLDQSGRLFGTWQRISVLTSKAGITVSKW